MERPGSTDRSVCRRASLETWRATACCFGVFALGGVAQGIPFVLVAVTLERQVTGSGWLAAVAVARLAPYLVCSAGAGALAGRFDAGLIFAITGGARGAIAIALGIAITVHPPPALLILLLFALVAVGTPAYPALMRVVYESTPAHSRDRAAAVAAGLESAVFWAGPAVGGGLLVLGEAAATSLSATMALASAVLAWTVPAVTAPASRASARSAMLLATKCLLGPVLRPAVLSVVGANLLAGLVTAVLVRLPVELQLGGDREYGLLSFAQGCGAGAAFVALVWSVGAQRRPVAPLAALGGAVALLATSGHLAVALMACTLLGASIFTSEVQATRALGRAALNSSLAPAIGLLDAWMVASMIAGACAGPLLSSTIGLRWTLLGAATAVPLLAFAGCPRPSSPPGLGATPGRPVPTDTDQRTTARSSGCRRHLGAQAR
jgi:hypothetical protein